MAGWSIHVATWSGHDVKIAVSLDQYSRARKRAFWIGFGSREYASIQRLFSGLPLEWRHRDRVLTNEDAISRIDGSGEEIWILAQPSGAARFGKPIAEDYEGELKYFGLYDPSDELDLDRAIGFLESVIIAQRQGADDETTDIRHIERRNDLDATKKETLIQARRGRGKFREELEEIWERCPVSPRALAGFPHHAVPERQRRAAIGQQQRHPPLR